MNVPYCAQYVAHCGQTDCPLFGLEIGTNNKVWSNRLCQFGTEELAKQGRTYVDILKHYYGDSVKLSNEGGGSVVDPINDAVSYGVGIEPVLGLTKGEVYYKITKVHHLTPEENRGNHHVYIDVLDRDSKRIYGAKIDIGWPTGASFAIVDKPANEPGTNVPLTAGQVVRVSVHGVKSEVATGIKIMHPREGPDGLWMGHAGNDVGHHSFLIIWQENIYTSSDIPVPIPPTLPVTITIPILHISEQGLMVDGTWRIILEGK